MEFFSFLGGGGGGSTLSVSSSSLSWMKSCGDEELELVMVEDGILCEEVAGLVFKESICICDGLSPKKERKCI